MTMEEVDRQELLKVWAEMDRESDPAKIAKLKEKEKAILSMLQ